MMTMHMIDPIRDPGRYGVKVVLADPDACPEITNVPDMGAATMRWLIDVLDRASRAVEPPDDGADLWGWACMEVATWARVATDTPLARELAAIDALVHGAAWIDEKAFDDELAVMLTEIEPRGTRGGTVGTILARVPIARAAVFVAYAVAGITEAMNA